MPESASFDDPSPFQAEQRFQESYVGLPFHSLEDLPQGGSDDDARALLSAWSVLWHPLVIVRCGAPPHWVGVDALPELTGDRLIAVDPSTRDDPALQGRHDFTDLSFVSGEHPVQPSDQSATADGNAAADSDESSRPGMNWLVSGPDRDSMLDQLGLGSSRDQRSMEFWGDCPESLRSSSREITAEDFFALAYASLQIQVMTRRLRYSSNLDTILLHRHATNAATAFVGGDAEAAMNALHDAFDLLSEERDHYFASDPSLIDLTLLTPGTLSRLDSAQFDQRALPEPVVPEAEHALPEEGDQPTTPEVPPLGTEDASSALHASDPSQPDSMLPLPGNVLLDESCCKAMQANSDRDDLAWFREAISEGRIGLATGGPSEIRFDEHSYRAGADAIRTAYDLAATTFGRRPTVYARLSGSTPVDLTSVLARLGYRGVIPLDFVRGTGHGAEAKVLQQTSAGELEALTSKPIDASADAAFLNLAAKLGESIDSGEIATGLFAHWPGEGCASFHDLRRAASWSLALGKFWRLEDYFVDGEHPYHHADTSALGNDAIESITDRIDRSESPAFASMAEPTQQEQRDWARRIQKALNTLATGDTSSESVTDDNSQDVDGLAHQFANSLKLTPSQDSNVVPNARLVLNHLSSGQRTHLVLADRPAVKTKQVYGVSSWRDSSKGDDGFMVTSDTPGLGFSILSGDPNAESKSSFFSKQNWLPKRLTGSAGIAQGETLQNQFLEATIQRSSGGIGSVFSGQQRGNRFSLRLVRVTDNADDRECEMICDEIRTLESTEYEGVIQTSGRLVVRDGDSEKSMRNLGDYRLRYQLHRGSRMIFVEGELSSLQSCERSTWKNYYGVRVATALDSALDRVIVRDKLHRSIGRRMVAPLGVLIDESERETLVASGGFSYHRRVGNRFLDTLIAGGKDREVRFRFGYAFDAKSAVATAKSLLVPAVEIALQQPGSSGHASQGSCSQQWLVHRSPSTVDVSELDVFRREDGRLAVRVQLIQTTNQAVRASLQFCRPMAFAICLDDESIDLPSIALDQFASPLDVKSDQIRLSMSGHSVVDLFVVFQTGSESD